MYAAYSAQASRLGLSKTASQTIRQGMRSKSLSKVLPLKYPRPYHTTIPLLSLPSDTYQLLSSIEKAGTAEDHLFQNQIDETKRWWASSRYKGIKRPYSPEDVASKRGTLQQVYPSSLMARKLFDLLREKADAGHPVYTSELPAEL